MSIDLCCKILRGPFLYIKDMKVVFIKVTELKITVFRNVVCVLGCANLRIGLTDLDIVWFPLVLWQTSLNIKMFVFYQVTNKKVFTV